MTHIHITEACEGNLKNISVSIPKNKLVVFTGLSGSGKSTLLVDVLFQECQRQYLEAMSLQGIHKPKVERIRGASPAILISQTDNNKNPRSTVGTLSDIYTDLRMIYEKLGIRRCPFCSDLISSADCREETEKINHDFHVYMYCCKCGQRMDKITRSFFSFNTTEGACPTCEGLGRIHRIKKEAVTDEDLSLEQGAVMYWEKQYGTYQLSILHRAFRHYGIPIPNNLPVRQYSDIQKTILYEGVNHAHVKRAFPGSEPPKNTASGRFEGVYPILWRRLSEKNGESKQLEPYFDIAECPDCKGERLGALSRQVTVNHTRLPELSLFSLERLSQWMDVLETSLSERQQELVCAYLRDIKTKLNRFLKVGLGYLTPDRQTVTLSGGELQRLRLAAALDCELSGILYILDEPTAGLHPKDTQGLLEILKRLRDLGNSVLVIEHDTDVMASADYIIDMGPGSGREGGEIIAAGTLGELLKNASSVTGNYLRTPHPGKTMFRKASGAIHIHHAEKFNLKDLSLDLPTGCLLAVTGPSGSGKSTLIFEVLAKGSPCLNKNRVTGLEAFDSIIAIGQSPSTRMKRSNAATYSGVYGEIRSIFAKTPDAKKAGFTARHFSFNTPGGRCENCEGLGYINNNLLFFADTAVVCPVCNGALFHRNILDVKYKGYSITDILNLSAEETADIFSDLPKISRFLNLLRDVGLGYLKLGQSLTTLSYGECQRLKLAKELIANTSGKKNLYLMDEPTTGLHPIDVNNFLVLLNRLVDAGNSVIVVEHNQQLIDSCDWIIDLGPEGGEKGGRVMFQGRPGLGM